MADVKAAEVSAIIKQQLTGFDAGVSLDEVGSVLQVECFLYQMIAEKLSS